MKARQVSYRARQLWRAARAQLTSQDLAVVQSILTPTQMELFTRLQPAEQAHSLELARRLMRRGEGDADLLTAALLHDVGKTCQPLRLWERVWIVLGSAAFPRLRRKWGSVPENGASPSFLRRPFVVAERHPQWGAQLALGAGVSPRAAELISRHQSTPAQPVSGAPDRLLQLLQSVDDES